MGLSFFLKKRLFFKKIDFPKIRFKTVQYFNSVHAHNPKFGLFFAITRSQLFFLPFSFPFSRPFYSRYLFRCIFFLAAVKRWVLIMAKA